MTQSPVLTRPSDELIDRLASDPMVDSGEVREALCSIAGLTFHEALAFVDTIRDRRDWSLDTFLAVMEGIDSVRNVVN